MSHFETRRGVITTPLIALCTIVFWYLGENAKSVFRLPLPVNGLYAPWARALVSADALLTYNQYLSSFACF